LCSIRKSRIHSEYLNSRVLGRCALRLGKCSRSGSYFANITTSCRRRGNFQSKSPPELLGRLVRSRTNGLLREGRRQDRERMRYRFGCSKVQVAYKLRISVALAAFSADANARLMPCRGREPFLHSTLVIAVPEYEWR